MSSSEATLRRPLLRWYDRNRRDLPWRRTSDPYAIWLSEIMLQQTTVAAVVPHWLRFLERFPDLASLAGAREAEVLGAWSGLGYYSRARNLHRAARELLGRGERWPRTAAELRLLPGFGPYTAAAVASIAFGERVAVVDGNVVRVVARLDRLPGHARDAALLRAVRERVDRWIDPARPGDWNQAVMELGARVCRPRDPDCEACPLARRCFARAAGAAGSIPSPPPRRETESIRLAAAVLVQRERLLVRTRQGTGFLDGLTEVPTVRSDDDDAAPLLRRALRGAGVRSLRLVDSGREARQVVTHRRLRVAVWIAEAAALPRPGGGFSWLPLAEPLPLPSLFRKVVTAARAARPERFSPPR